MPIVDASLVVSLALSNARSPLVETLLEGWAAAEDRLHAPDLLPYEVASGLTRAVAAGEIRARDVPDAWRILMKLPVTFHSVWPAGAAVVAIARQLQRHSAYDAAYLALALALGAEVWTFDAKLARDAGDLGYPVRLVDAAA